MHDEEVKREGEETETLADEVLEALGAEAGEEDPLMAEVVEEDKEKDWM
ncbi:MAG TPA: hypothetical protein VJH91_03100 [Candidatus Paceibacterota bacterium]